jgi:hypothetical protein
LANRHLSFSRGNRAAVRGKHTKKRHTFGRTCAGEARATNPQRPTGGHCCPRASGEPVPGKSGAHYGFSKENHSLSMVY